jgi:TP901 family phage tail tape measure protein
MASEAFQLALLLTLKDAASGGLDRFEARLRSIGKAGEMELAKLDKLREDLNKDLAIGGVGLAGLKILKDGVQAAGDYQSVMTDLRSSLAQVGKDGKVNLGQLALDMTGAEAVAVRLGNKLPGTTADFAQMMQVLKHNGLEAKTIMNGAADAVANLAVANNAVPKEIAADFARYGNLFKLRPEDFTPAADVFSRIYSSTGQTSAELIEAAKYFQGRIGQGLQIGGLADAERYTRLFGFMGKRGITGSVAGAGLSNFFESYNVHRDKLDDLAKATGIKLDFFDKQGKFVGLDTVMEQMQQFDKLSAKDRTQWMEKIFGTLGSQAANVMVDAKGWKEFNEEQAKTISLQDKSALKAQDYNMKMESLQGTLTNLKVAIFEPMLPGATAALDKANELVGVIQTFAKSHPDIAKYAVSFLGIGSAALVAYSGVKTLTTGFQLLKMTSAFARGTGIATQLAETTTVTERATRAQAGFVRQNDVVRGSLVQTGAAANTATKGVNGLATSTAVADTKAVGLRKNLFSLNNVFKAVMVLEAVGFTWDQIENLRKTAKEWDSLNKGLDISGQQSYKFYQQQKAVPADETRRQIGELTAQNPKAAATFQLLAPDAKREAATATSLLQMRNDNVQKSLDPTRKNWTDIGMDFGRLLHGRSLTWDAPLASDSPLNARRQERLEYYSKQPERSGKWGAMEYGIAAVLPAITPLLTGGRISPQELADREIRGANYFQKRAPALADPQVMAAFRQQEVPKMNLEPQMKADLDNMLKLAFPESFAASMTGMFDQGSQAFVQAISSLQQPIQGTAEIFSGLPPTVTPVGESFATMPPPMAETQAGLANLPQPMNDVAGALGNMAPPASRLPGAFNNIFTSASSVASSLDNVSVKLASWQPPQAQVVQIPAAGPATAAPLFGVPGRAIGGVVERDGMAYVHAGNVITPAGVTRGLSGFGELMSLARGRDRQQLGPQVLRYISESTTGSSNEILRSITSSERLGSSSARSTREATTASDVLRYISESSASESISSADSIRSDRTASSVESLRSTNRQSASTVSSSLRSLSQSVTDRSSSDVDRSSDREAMRAESVLRYFSESAEYRDARRSFDRDTVLNSLVERQIGRPAASFPSPPGVASAPPDLFVDGPPRGAPLNLSMTAPPSISKTATFTFSAAGQPPGSPDQLGRVGSTRRDGKETSIAESFASVSRRDDARKSSLSQFVDSFRSTVNETRDRYAIDPDLVRDADRSSRIEGGADIDGRSSGSASVVFNAGAFNFSPQIIAKTIEQAEQDLDRNYKTAKARYLQQLRKDFDNRRLRA